MSDQQEIFDRRLDSFEARLSNIELEVSKITIEFTTIKKYGKWILLVLCGVLGINVPNVI